MLFPNLMKRNNKIFIQLMRMKNRFCRMGKTLLGAACLLSTCGVTYSCSDDFDLDETRPSFLGESIYDELKNAHKFNTVIRLIDDLGMTEVMSRTGSKTVFVADDKAYEDFFATTTWKDGAGNPVRSYDQLSTAQKRWLLNGSMLDNAYVLEMLTTLQGPVKNLCLRQLSSMGATDTVPYFRWDELPENLNKGQLDANGKVLNADKRFWDKYRTQSRGGIYMALDGTAPMLTHFLEAQMNEKKITHSDVSFILNLDGTANEWKDEDTDNRSYVYDAQIVEGDKVCLNGYYHVLDKVLVTPMNMAELIRTNGQTNLFSKMLDRFSAPYYDKAFTDNYKLVHEISADSVFLKRYIAQRSQGNDPIVLDPDNETLGDFPALSYDPGWNTYTMSGTTKEQDMAAMFVPSDAAMTRYFVYGGGAHLINRYSDRPNTEENLEYNLYQIPLNIVKPLIANLMKDSFNETVPSKYLTIMNDAQDQMFSAAIYPTGEKYRALFDNVMLANNGVVYVMNSVIAPATYSSVMAPALYNENAQVVNTIIHADDAYTTTNYANAPLRRFYSTYLLSMQSNFSLFVPTDDGLKDYGYIEPMAYAAYAVSPTDQRRLRYWTLEPEAMTQSSGGVAIRATAYRYYMDRDMDPDNKTAATGTIRVSAANDYLTTDAGKIKKHILIEMLDQHILVHDQGTEGEKGVNADRNYYLSRSGAPVYIKSRATGENGVGMVVDGGLQCDFNSDAIEGNEFDCKVTNSFDMTRNTNEYGNGMTYFLDRPMQPTLFNVFQKLNTTPEYSAFLQLCTELNDETSLIQTLFKGEDMSDETWANEQKKYQIFSPNNGSGTGRLTAVNTRLIRFFNNYRYTIFVPTNEAVQDAIDHGLPTMTQIREYVENNTDSETGELNPEAKAKAQAMVTTYVNFLKYHFCDQSLYVDNVTADSKTQSACTNQLTQNFIDVNVHQKPNAISVTDATKQTYQVQAPYNVLARDFELSKESGGNSSPSTSRSITSSSYVVLHSINGYMRFGDEVKESFDAAWKTAATAKAFVKKYRLKK